MKKTVFIKNAAVLTATSFILRLLGIVFKVWLASQIGSEGIGIYHLVFSVHILACAFAASPLPTAVTRLVAEKSAVGDTNGEKKAVKGGIIIALVFSAISFCVIFFGARFFANSVLGDARTLMPLKIMCVSVPFVAASGVIKGYFYAKRKVVADSARVLIEQVIRLAVCFLLVSRFIEKGIVFALCAVIFADTVSEIFSFLFCLALYIKEDSAKEKAGSCKAETREILRISSPILASRYSTTALRTAENVLVPKALSKTMSYTTALSHFGSVKGMALPVLFFPSSVLSALSSLLLPEMSEAVAQKRPFIIKNAVKKTLKTTWLLGVIFGCIFFFISDEIATLIYKDSYIGYLIKFLSPIVPLMYLDGISDGILKGLDLQGFCFKVALADSVMRLIFIAIFVPRYSMTAFLIIMTASNVFTCFVTTAKLLRTTKVSFSLFKEILLPLLFACAICISAKAVFLSVKNQILYCGAFSLSCVVAYILFLLAFKIVDINDYI